MTYSLRAINQPRNQQPESHSSPQREEQRERTKHRNMSKLDRLQIERKLKGTLSNLHACLLFYHSTVTVHFPQLPGWR